MKPNHTKNDAVLKAADVAGRRPQRGVPGAGGPRAEWRDTHWRVWLHDGWVDLDNDLEVIAVSEEFAD